MRKNKEQGFTLIELVVAMAIFAILGLMTITVFSAGLKFTDRNQNIQERTESIRLVFRILDKDLRTSSQYIAVEDKDSCYTLKDKKSKQDDLVYCLLDDTLSKNGKVLIDKIGGFKIEALGKVLKVEIAESEEIEINEGLKITLVDSEGKEYDHKIYFRLEK